MASRSAKPGPLIPIPIATATAAANIDVSPIINNVSLSLYGAATSTIPEGNLMISPLSILYSTILVYLGSRGSTRTNLYNSLDFKELASSDSSPDIVTAFGKLMSDLKVTSAKEAGKSNDTDDNKFQLALANGIFIRDGLNVDKTYLSTANQNLKASVDSKNFNDNPEGARADINKWVEERTGGRIKNLIPSGALDGSTVAVLANAIYFKARWENVFDDFLTEKNGTFTAQNGKRVKAKLMRIRKKFSYAEDSTLGVQYLEMPYADNEASMLIYLPQTKTGLRQLEKSLTTQTIVDLAKTAQADDKVLVDVALPKFRVESSFDLVQLLRKIGVNDVFTENADLSGMLTSGSAQVSSGFHKTFIEVDEKGTEAAGANAMIEKARSGHIGSQGRRVTFRADHPFIYAIRHNRSKAILFMGRLETF
ncbi:leukocyte elastase inhibitor-like [Paramacrobiotus metropolitanus]|uniref:leukocyte elastase inhibitor-like n=1 Tax=Paramacrobiotus metropolitanus TaxID=2943436 RepID=UPI002445631D|nr:leukocyte elastase inhibitor-like [Paramacrobiotus metropolitanus]